MINIRQSILKQIADLELTIYQVSKMVKDKISQRTVYAFLAGEKDTSTEAASMIMEALGLNIGTSPNKTQLLKGTGMKAQKSKSFRGRVVAEWEQAEKPKWGPRELLGICLLIDLEFRIEGPNPAKKFREAVEAKDYKYLKQWVGGLKFKTWK